MQPSVLLSDSDSPVLAEAVKLLDGWRLESRPEHRIAEAVDTVADVRAVVLTGGDPGVLRTVIENAQRRGVAVIMGAADDAARRRAAELRISEWFLMPGNAEEIAARVRSALTRTELAGAALVDRVGRVEYEQMLYDYLTGLPTLPVMIERSRALIKERGELIVLYFNFVRYSKIEEIYGWEKLDAVLETTALAVREFLHDSALNTSRVMVSFANDDDFVFFHVPAHGVPAATDAQITELVGRLQVFVASKIEEAHGEDIAALFDIYVGRSHV